jgi:hypothetical protein
MADVGTMPANNMPGAAGAGSMAGTPGTGGAGATTPMMGAIETGSQNTPIEYNDPEMKCYEFRAHAPGDKNAPFSVSTQPDLYTSFFFSAPWTGMQYARSMTTALDNTVIIHHYLLFKEDTVTADGTIAPPKPHLDGQLLQGWAPGGDDLYYSPDLGQEMPPVTYLLETHHNNTTGGAAPDHSGIKVCVTPKVPEHIASISWLGTDAISGLAAQGICNPKDDGPIYILGGTPHMHKKGVKMTVTVNRVGGASEVLHDKPFDFMNQVGYANKTVIMPGDTITTKCTYNAPANFGEGTSDEMCYYFTLYYPKLSLTDVGVGSVVHGANQCGVSLF